MRVLHIQKASGIGGSERHLLDLLAGQRARAMDAHLCVLASENAWRLMDESRSRGIPVVEMPAGPDLNPVALARLVAEIRRLRPDLVHTHLIHADVHGQLAAQLARVPALSSIHSTALPYRREPFRTVAAAVGHLARRTIAISHHVGRFIVERKLARPDRIRVVHYGIDVEGWQTGGADRSRARHDLGIGTEEVAVAVASRLVPYKGHDFLLRAMNEAIVGAPQLRLLVAGEGPLRPDLERQAAPLMESGHVRFLGFVPEVRSLFGAADIVAFPTMPEFGEGFGLVNLEAMAAGRPVIATALDSVPEVVLHEETGLLVTPDDVRQLAQGLEALAHDADRRVAMGDRGRARAQREFTIERMVDRTVDVYREIV